MRLLKGTPPADLPESGPLDETPTLPGGGEYTSLYASRVMYGSADNKPDDLVAGRQFISIGAGAGTAATAAPRMIVGRLSEKPSGLAAGQRFQSKGA